MTSLSSGDENDSAVGTAFGEATGRDVKQEKRAKNDVSGEDVVVLASGNLGLVYLMDEQRRMTMEEIQERHPRLLPRWRASARGLAARPLGRARRGGGRRGWHALSERRPRGGRGSAHELLSERTRATCSEPTGSPTSPTSWSARFYEPETDEGCAFEELISFHGGLGGPQTEPFILHPAGLRVPDEPIVGAASVNALLRGWRAELEGSSADGATRRDRYGMRIERDTT